ncbi:MAG: twin-arginine translocase TatA/TatE family subunit [Nannocystis sp.]|nr:twin-arginine translocase TatA/TatE family subunit [Nannocystis sp.]MBA3549893.1 twin-arginine translocase TatA/TatE family subunit [Nannocystis sp.]
MLLGIGGLGGLELVIIIVVILLIFGPTKLPQLGEGIGKMLRGFRKEIKQIDNDKREEEARRGEIDVTPKAADDKSKYTGPG